MMDPAKARAALQLIEYISDRLTQTRLLFASDAEHKKAFHGEAAQAVRDWRRSSVCMFPGLRPTNDHRLAHASASWADFPIAGR